MNAKQMIVAVLALGSGLVTALVALSYPGWANSPLATMVYIPGVWVANPHVCSRWFDYVLGAVQLGGLTAALFTYSKISWKQNVAILFAAIVFGTLSWFAGVFVVVMGLWVTFATMYATKRFDQENRTRKQEGKFFTLGRSRWEAAGCLMLGAAFSVGLKYGLGQGLFLGSVFAAMLFIVVVFPFETLIEVMGTKFWSPPKSSE